ncbi:MAG: Uncharacterized protein G01um10147_461 [Microgenomates group bacterium Gr01-1014_7]|nr:MAG: Uncharacterized protein G01um10147_461 [Microgenomates group bacterium Gr01-1014_7]
MWLLRQSLGNPKTILDLGCGDGNLMELLADGKEWQVTGVDLYAKNVKIASKRSTFTKVYKADIVKFVKQEIIKRKKYDVVFCSQVIEHLDYKRGEELLSLIESIARQRVIIGTPREFMKQPHGYLGDNPHQVHKSGWSEEDFRKRGYKVFGIGFSPLWSEAGLIRINHNRVLISFYFAVSFLLSPIVYFIPKIAAGILCIKNIK